MSESVDDLARRAAEFAAAATYQDDAPPHSSTPLVTDNTAGNTEYPNQHPPTCGAGHPGSVPYPLTMGAPGVGLMEAPGRPPGGLCLPGAPYYQHHMVPPFMMPLVVRGAVPPLMYGMRPRPYPGFVRPHSGMHRIPEMGHHLGHHMPVPEMMYGGGMGVNGNPYHLPHHHHPLPHMAHHHHLHVQQQLLETAVSSGGKEYVGEGIHVEGSSGAAGGDGCMSSTMQHIQEQHRQQFEQMWQLPQQRLAVGSALTSGSAVIDTAGAPPPVVAGVGAAAAVPIGSATQLLHLQQPPPPPPPSVHHTAVTHNGISPVFMTALLSGEGGGPTVPTGGSRALPQWLKDAVKSVEVLGGDSGQDDPSRVDDNDSDALLTPPSESERLAVSDGLRGVVGKMTGSGDTSLRLPVVSKKNAANVGIALKLKTTLETSDTAAAGDKEEDASSADPLSSFAADYLHATSDPGNIVVPVMEGGTRQFTKSRATAEDTEISKTAAGGVDSITVDSIINAKQTAAGIFCMPPTACVPVYKKESSSSASTINNHLSTHRNKTDSASATTKDKKSSAASVKHKSSMKHQDRRAGSCNGTEYDGAGRTNNDEQEEGECFTTADKEEDGYMPSIKVYDLDGNHIASTPFNKPYFVFGSSSKYAHILDRESTSVYSQHCALVHIASGKYYCCSYYIGTAAVHCYNH
eukprot:Lankesteria_metandrocarpae@DN4051_c0_g1_i2.p1